ncbi:NfeD family protein [Mycoplasma simbae]|uniref:NfeD family protein n=1 Tax=Mycoplasma simbae TaxID=36744 RepID=UPI0004984C84|nr:NfeD family protein [Mycoplasma simbae]
MTLTNYVLIALYIGIFLVFALAEMLTSGIWLGLTSLASVPSIFISAFVKNSTLNIVLGLIIFAISWVIVYLSFYRLLKRKFGKSKENTDRIDSLIGKKHLTLTTDAYENSDQNDQYGQAKVNGVIYRVASAKGSGIIAKGSKVRIIKIEGNIIYVAPEEKN